MEVERLSNCELDVMKVLWEADGRLSQADLKSRLEMMKSRMYARTTVATWLARLKKKEYVQTYTEAGVTYCEAVLHRAEYEHMEVLLLTDRLFQGSLPRLVATYAEVKSIGKAEAERVKEILDGWVD